MEHCGTSSVVLLHPYARRIQPNSQARIWSVNECTASRSGEILFGLHRIGQCGHSTRLDIIIRKLLNKYRAGPDATAYLFSAMSCDLIRLLSTNSHFRHNKFYFARDVNGEMILSLMMVTTRKAISAYGGGSPWRLRGFIHRIIISFDWISSVKIYTE